MRIVIWEIYGTMAILPFRESDDIALTLQYNGHKKNVDIPLSIYGTILSQLMCNHLLLLLVNVNW